MPSLETRNSVGAGLNINNVVGTFLDIVATAGILTIWGNSGTGAAATDITHQLQIFKPNQADPSLPIPLSVLPLGSTTDAIKTDEELLSPRITIPQGSRIIHTIFNAAAAGRTPIFRYFLET